MTTPAKGTIEFRRFYHREYWKNMSPEQRAKAAAYQKRYEARPENRARKREQRKRSYDANPDRARAYAREWKARLRATPEGREKNRAALERFRQAHPLKAREHVNKAARKMHHGIRFEAVRAYGGQCACCGESNYAFLELDHIKNDGKAHRAQTGNSYKMLRDLKAAGWPPILQALCANCHRAKTRYGACVHYASLVLNEAFYAYA